MIIRTMTPAKALLVFLAGFVLGVFLIARSHAAEALWEPAPHKKSHAVSHKKARKAIAHRSKAHKKAVARHASRPKIKVAAKPKPKVMPMEAYAHPDGLYQLKYPAGWQVNAHGNAMVVKSAGQLGDRAVFGIVRRPDTESNDDAVSKEFAAHNRPADLIRTSARVAGMPATKVIGSNKLDPNSRMVEYYVQDLNGRQYYVLLMAPKEEWSRYTVAFNSMLKNLSFN